MTWDRPAALNQMMRAVLLVFLLALTAACGAYQFPGAPASPATATVTGRVLSVPCAPVQKAGEACAGRPVPNLEINYIQNGATVAKTVTDATGTYIVHLQPGTYAVKLKTYMRVISGPLTITVDAGSNLIAPYTLDSGIRVPVPQQ